MKLLESCKEEPAIRENTNDIIENEEVCEIPIPKRLGNPILQIRKTIIPKINHLTNTEVQVKKICTIEIVGDNSESVFKAKEQITEIISPNSNPNPNLVQGINMDKKKTFEMQMQIPKQFLCYIIDRKRQIIQSGAKINIDPSKSIVNIIAETSDSVSNAEKMIKKKLVLYQYNFY